MTYGLQVWPVRTPLMLSIQSSSLQHPKFRTAPELKLRLGVLRCFKATPLIEAAKELCSGHQSWPGPAAAVLPSHCILYSHPTHSHKPKSLQEHLPCFLWGTNQGKSGVHQTHMGFISYEELWYVPGKEKFSLHACCLGVRAMGVPMLQSRKAIHLVEVHCSLERARQHQQLCFVHALHHLRVICTPPGAFRLYLCPISYSPVFKECSKPTIAKTDSPSEGGSITPPPPLEAAWPTSSPNSPLPSPPECTVGSPRSHTHHPRVSRQGSGLQQRGLSSPIPW